MPYRDEGYDLLVEFDSKNHTLSSEERGQLTADLDTLSRVLKTFPSPQLHVEIDRHPRSGEYHVKVALHLPKRTLFTGERDPLLHPAYKRCVRKMLHKVEGFKRSLSGKHNDRKRLRQETQVTADWQPDHAAMQRARDADDFAAFREQVGVYRDTLDKRIGRWIERYPAAAAELGDGLLIYEIREEVFLNAFEQFDTHPAPTEGFGEWLASFIDGSVKALLDDPDGERRNLGFVGALRGREASVRQPSGETGSAPTVRG